MNRNPNAITTRSRLGAWARVCASGVAMSGAAGLLNFGDSSPDPGNGGVPS